MEHTYPINGTYEVVATVRDMFHAVTDTLEVRVFGEVPTFTLVEPEEGAAALPGETVTLHAEAFDPDGSPVVIKWVIAQVHDTHEHPDIFIARSVLGIRAAA